MNPGLRQVKFPCQICNRAGKWKQETLACDNCDGWYHVKCMKMQSAVYKHLQNQMLSGCAAHVAYQITQHHSSNNVVSIHQIACHRYQIRTISVLN